MSRNTSDIYKQEVLFMTAKTAQIAEMIDMLPDKEIEEAEQSGYISSNEIDWDNLDKIV